LSLGWFRGVDIGPIRLMRLGDVELKLNELRARFLRSIDEEDLVRIIREYRGRV
jgi:hypothetical protein